MVLAKTKELWNLESSDHVNNLLMLLLGCSIYGLDINISKEIVSPLWINLWDLTPGIQGLYRRTRLCLLAMQHKPISVRILKLLAWSTIFGHSRNLIDFILEYDRNLEFQVLIDLLQNKNICFIVLSYYMKPKLIRYLVSSILYSLCHKGHTLFPQIVLFPLKRCQQTATNSVYDYATNAWRNSPVDPVVHSENVETVVLIQTLKGVVEDPERCIPFFNSNDVQERIKTLRRIVYEVENELSNSMLYVT